MVLLLVILNDLCYFPTIQRLFNQDFKCSSTAPGPGYISLDIGKGRGSIQSGKWDRKRPWFVVVTRVPPSTREPKRWITVIRGTILISNSCRGPPGRCLKNTAAFLPSRFFHTSKKWYESSILASNVDLFPSPALNVLSPVFSYTLYMLR